MTLRVAYIFLVLAVSGHADFVVEPASGSAVTSTDEGMELLQMRGAEAKSVSLHEGDAEQELVDMLEQKGLETSDWGWAVKAKAALQKLFGINKQKQEKAEADLAAAEAAKKESARLAAEKKAQKEEAQAVAAAKKAEAALKKKKEAEAAAEADRLAAEAKAEAEAIKAAERAKKAQEEADLKKAQEEAARLAAEQAREDCSVIPASEWQRYGIPDKGCTAAWNQAICTNPNYSWGKWWSSCCKWNPAGVNPTYGPAQKRQFGYIKGACEAK